MIRQKSMTKKDAFQTFGTSNEKKKPSAPTAGRHRAVSGSNVIFVAMSDQITRDISKYNFLQIQIYLVKLEWKRNVCQIFL